jgi:hypothetical protein
MKHYLVLVEGLIDPSVIEGPLESNDELFEAAKEVVKIGAYDLGEDGEDALFWIEINDDGVLEIGSFSGGFMDEAREAI